MSKLSEGTEVIGASVAHALVGTMLGVFCAYGLIEPTATKMAADIEAEGRYLQVIRAALVALHGQRRLAFGFGLAKVLVSES